MDEWIFMKFSGYVDYAKWNILEHGMLCFTHWIQDFFYLLDPFMMVLQKTEGCFFFIKFSAYVGYEVKQGTIT